MATRLRESTADRISNLPDGVIERILVFLPIKDAARTSLLSRGWRHCWRSIPQLVFDDYFAPTPAGNSYLPDENKVVMQIYEALLGHDGPITKFELSISGLRNPKVDLLMRYLSRKGVQELTLLLWDCEGLELHSSMFFALPQNRLKLQCCTFSLASWFVGFSKLNLVEFNEVILPDDFWENFIPYCPLLEELRVFDCISGTEHVFVAPSLKVLLFHSSFEKICFNYTPLLSVVSVLDTDEFMYDEDFFVKHNPDMVSLFASLPALEHLNLGIELLLFLADGHVPYQLPTALRNLKFLEVPHILLHRLPQAQVLVCLIMSAPNLQRLTIRLDDDFSHRHPCSEAIASLQKLLEAEDHPGVSCLQHLEEFNIQESRGTQVELDLVRFVLATAPVLRMISIRRKEKLLSSKKVLKFSNEMLLYRRISKEAKIKYV